MTTKLKRLKTLSFDAQKNGRTEVSGEKDKQLRPAKTPGKDKLSKLSDLLKKVPAHTFEQSSFDHVTPRTVTQKNDGRGNSEFVGTHSGTRGSSSVQYADGALTGEFQREAVWGANVEKSGAVTGKYGSAGYQANGTLDASASVSGDGRLDTNGLVLNGGAHANVSAEVTVHATASTKSVTILGVETNASVEANGRAVAELNAEASGTAQITRRPPTAIVSGKAGVSAVAKVEGDINAHAGPFSLHAAGYASAGAEATASGIFGYQNGTLRIGGSAGAAFGLGAGGNFELDLNVGMLKDAAKNAADRNHDGKVNLIDVAAGLGQLFHAADRNHDGHLSRVDASLAFNQASMTFHQLEHKADDVRDAVRDAVQNAVRHTASKWTHRLLG